MPVGTIDIPGAGALPPIGYAPFSPGPTPASINTLIQNFNSTAINAQALINAVPAATPQGTGIQVALQPQKFTFVLTDTQIKTLNSVPVDLLLPSGAQKVVIDYWWLEKGPWTNAYNANPSVRLRYVGIATDLITALTPGLSGTGYSRQGGAPAGNGFTTNPAGLKVQVSASVDVASVGNTVGNTLTVTAVYHVE